MIYDLHVQSCRELLKDLKESKSIRGWKQFKSLLYIVRYNNVGQGNQNAQKSSQG
jgi:hypothetical protein